MNRTHKRTDIPADKIIDTPEEGATAYHFDENLAPVKVIKVMETGRSKSRVMLDVHGITRIGWTENYVFTKED